MVAAALAFLASGITPLKGFVRTLPLHLWNLDPAGWFEPWICEWQLVHARLNANRAVGN